MLTVFGCEAMQQEMPSFSKAQVTTSIFDKIPKSVAGYLYGIPQFFSFKQQLHTYGIPSGDGQSFKRLDSAIEHEIIDLLEEADFNWSGLAIMALNPEVAASTPGFVITSHALFVDENWWQSINTSITPDTDPAASSREIKRFFIALMIEQSKKGHYRKQLATKMVVDGVLVSLVIGVATYTLAPSVCSWVADSLPCSQWLGQVPTAVSTTIEQTCDHFYAPSMCVMASKTAWSSLLSPSVGPCVHALLTEPVANYLAQQSCSKAFESLVNRQALADYCTRIKTQGDVHSPLDELVTMVESSASGCSDY